ncbi:MAG: hypothetical protein ACLU6P_14200 [Roseburia intestinalis]
MRIVLDAVFNHCSMYLEQFMDVIKKRAGFHLFRLVFDQWQ